MPNCTICDQEVTPSMIRQGSAITRGPEIYHRECRPRKGLEVQADLVAGDLTGRLEYASFGRRLFAHVIDSFILNVIVIVPAFVVGFVAGMTGAVTPEGDLAGGFMFLTWGIAVGIPIWYCVWFWTNKSGATPGKTAMGLRVVSEDGAPLDRRQSIVRYFGYIPSALFLGLGYLAMIWDDENRCWHDRMARTRVVRV